MPRNNLLGCCFGCDCNDDEAQRAANNSISLAPLTRATNAGESSTGPSPHASAVNSSLNTPSAGNTGSHNAPTGNATTQASTQPINPSHTIAGAGNPFGGLFMATPGVSYEARAWYDPNGEVYEGDGVKVTQEVSVTYEPNPHYNPQQVSTQEAARRRRNNKKKGKKKAGAAAQSGASPAATAGASSSVSAHSDEGAVSAGAGGFVAGSAGGSQTPNNDSNANIESQAPMQPMSVLDDQPLAEGRSVSMAGHGKGKGKGKGKERAE